jgi:hypothetical protein
LSIIPGNRIDRNCRRLSLDGVMEDPGGSESEEELAEI